MKALSLYVDKWFITVAVNIDGNVLPLSLPNGEDRIWLFFHEDTANNRVVYGKTNESHYRDKELHYFGDIFTLIESGDNHFTRYDNRPEEMKEIFKVSNIFSHLHQAIKEDNDVNTYISFSADISDVARYKFIEELKESNFNVIESVARISHLALEESKKRGVFVQNGYYLVLVATNDNLHYSIYENKDSIFLRKSEASLPGLGLDVRRRALVESIVENLNRTTRLLSTPDELSQEYMRQDRFADEWLTKIVNSNPILPVAFSGITFAVAPNNPCSVSIFPKDLDERTNGIVEDIVRKISEFVKFNQLQSYEIKGIIFIGNTFTNRKFAAAINSRFIVHEDMIVIYKETELPKVVSIYSQIDCAQFRAATDKFVQDAKTQDILNQQAKEEEERQRKAAEEEQRQQEIRDRQRKAEQEYANAIEYVGRYESEHDYEQMREWAEIALTHRSEDEYAKEKLALAQQLLAEKRANNKQFHMVLQRAKTALADSRWSDAISQSEMALEFRPDSDEAKRIKKEAKRQLEIKDKVTNFLNRADVFFAQKLYSEALKEVGKVLNLDAANEAAEEIKRKISDVCSKHENTISGLVERLKNAEEKKDFSEAITICERLIEEDIPNLRKWSGKKERLISQERERVENMHKLSDLRTHINKALFNEDWQKLSLLCENYLTIEQDREISQFLVKSQKKIEGQKVKEAKEKAIGLINSLIIDKKFNEAENELNCFAQNYPSEQATVKDLRRKIFSFESGMGESVERSPTRKPFGFTSTVVSQDNAQQPGDDFWRTQPPSFYSRHQSTEPKKHNSSQKDDFFDSVTSKISHDTYTKKKYSKDNFNF